MTSRPSARESELDDETPIGELIETALDGARALANEEATLVLLELGDDGRTIARAVLVALAATMSCAVAIAWAGIALADALCLGSVGLALFSLSAAVLGALGLLGSRLLVPITILGQSRQRLERRLARVTERLR